MSRNVMHAVKARVCGGGPMWNRSTATDVTVPPSCCIPFQTTLSQHFYYVTVKLTGGGFFDRVCPRRCSTLAAGLSRLPPAPPPDIIWLAWYLHSLVPSLGKSVLCMAFIWQPLLTRGGCGPKGQPTFAAAWATSGACCAAELWCTLLTWATPWLHCAGHQNKRAQVKGFCLTLRTAVTGGERMFCAWVPWSAHQSLTSPSLTCHSVCFSFCASHSAKGCPSNVAPPASLLLQCRTGALRTPC